MTFLWFLCPWFEFHGNESKSSLSFYIILTLKLYLCSWINVLAPLEVKLLLRSHWDCSPSWKTYKVNWIRFEIILKVPLLFFTKSYPAMFAHLLWLCTGVPLYWSKTLQNFYSTTQKHRWPKITLFTFCFSWPTYKITGFLLCVLWGH